MTKNIKNFESWMQTQLQNNKICKHEDVIAQQQHICTGTKRKRTDNRSTDSEIKKDFNNKIKKEKERNIQKFSSHAHDMSSAKYPCVCAYRNKEREKELKIKLPKQKQQKDLINELNQIGKKKAIRGSLVDVK